MEPQFTGSSTRGRVIRGSAVQNSGTSSIAIPAGADHRKTEVHLIREGEIVREIEVTCSCGEILRLHCQYEEGQ